MIIMIIWGVINDIYIYDLDIYDMDNNLDHSVLLSEFSRNR